MPDSQPSSRYLGGYPASLRQQVDQLIVEEKLGNQLTQRYPSAHAIRTDRALYEYVSALRNEFLRNAAPLSKVAYDSTLHVIRNALGTHTTISRVQGNKLKAKRELRVSTLFREAPPEFLRLIVVHELAHLKERAHDKAFYQLCTHMEPHYHQLEFDLRAYLCYREAGGAVLWGGSIQSSAV